MIRETDSKSVLRRYVAAVQAGDENAVRELFAEYMDTLYASVLASAGSVDPSTAIASGR